MLSFGPWPALTGNECVMSCNAQVAGNLELPAPAARYEWQRDDAQRLSVGQGAFRLHLDQCNVVLNL